MRSIPFNKEDSIEGITIELSSTPMRLVEVGNGWYNVMLLSSFGTK